MLSNKKIICLNNLINCVKKIGIVDVVIVNVGEIFLMELVHKVVQYNLINLTFIGDENEIKKYVDKLKWDILKYTIINEKNENNIVLIVVKLVSEDKVKIIVKGYIYIDILMKVVLKRDLNLIGKKRLSYVWYMTLNLEDRLFIIIDGVVNVLLKLDVKMHIFKNVVEFVNKIGIVKPKVSILSVIEEVIESVLSLIEVNLIIKKVKEENINVDVFGFLVFDNFVSKKSVVIKKIKNSVVGSIDILLVPNVETGNVFVKMMVYFMGVCVVGVVLGCKALVVIISRSDEVEARLVSIVVVVLVLN